MYIGRCGAAAVIVVLLLTPGDCICVGHDVCRPCEQRIGEPVFPVLPRPTTCSVRRKLKIGSSPLDPADIGSYVESYSIGAASKFKTSTLPATHNRYHIVILQQLDCPLERPFSTISDVVQVRINCKMARTAFGGSRMATVHRGDGHTTTV